MWVVENFRPFEPTYGRGKRFKPGTKFVWEVAKVVHGGKILFRFTTIDGKSQCLVTMKELEHFVEVSEETIQKLVEQFRKQNRQKRNHSESDEPPKER